MRGLSYLLEWSTPYGRIGAITVAGILISTVGGFVTTVLVQRMSTEWWDEAAGRRAVLLFCLFPGSVIFSMVYAEGIAIPLAAGDLCPDQAPLGAGERWPESARPSSLSYSSW